MISSYDCIEIFTPMGKCPFPNVHVTNGKGSNSYLKAGRTFATQISTRSTPLSIGNFHSSHPTALNSATSYNLNLLADSLVIQAKLKQDVMIEIDVVVNMRRIRIFLSSNFGGDIHETPLHIMISLKPVPNNTWCEIIVPLHEILETMGGDVRLTCIRVSGSLDLRRMWTTKQGLQGLLLKSSGNSFLSDGMSMNDTILKSLQWPKTLAFAAGVYFERVFIPPTSSLLDRRQRDENSSTRSTPLPLADEKNKKKKVPFKRYQSKNSIRQSIEEVVTKAAISAQNEKSVPVQKDIQDEVKESQNPTDGVEAIPLAELERKVFYKFGAKAKSVIAHKKTLAMTEQQQQQQSSPLASTKETGEQFLTSLKTTPKSEKILALEDRVEEEDNDDPFDYLKNEELDQDLKEESQQDLKEESEQDLNEESQQDMKEESVQDLKEESQQDLYEESLKDESEQDIDPFEYLKRLKEKAVNQDNLEILNTDKELHDIQEAILSVEQKIHDQKDKDNLVEISIIMDGHDDEGEHECEDFIVESPVEQIVGKLEVHEMGIEGGKVSYQSDNNIVSLEQVMMEKLKSVPSMADDTIIESAILDQKAQGNLTTLNLAASALGHEESDGKGITSVQEPETAAEEVNYTHDKSDERSLCDQTLSVDLETLAVDQDDSDKSVSCEQTTTQDHYKEFDCPDLEKASTDDDLHESFPCDHSLSAQDQVTSAVEQEVSAILNDPIVSLKDQQSSTECVEAKDEKVPSISAASGSSASRIPILSKILTNSEKDSYLSKGSQKKSIRFAEKVQVLCIDDDIYSIEPLRDEPRKKKPSFSSRIGSKARKETELPPHAIEAIKKTSFADDEFDATFKATPASEAGSFMEKLQLIKKEMNDRDSIDPFKSVGNLSDDNEDESEEDDPVKVFHSEILVVEDSLSEDLENSDCSHVSQAVGPSILIEADNEELDDDQIVEADDKVDNDQIVEDNENLENDQLVEDDEKPDLDDSMEADEKLENDQLVEDDEKPDSDDSMEADEKLDSDQIVEDDEKMDDDQLVEDEENLDSDESVKVNGNMDNDQSVEAAKKLENSQLLDAVVNLDKNDQFVGNDDDLILSGDDLACQDTADLPGSGIEALAIEYEGILDDSTAASASKIECFEKNGAAESKEIYSEDKVDPKSDALVADNCISESEHNRPDQEEIIETVALEMMLSIQNDVIDVLGNGTELANSDVDDYDDIPADYEFTLPDRLKSASSHAASEIEIDPPCPLESTASSNHSQIEDNDIPDSHDQKDCSSNMSLNEEDNEFPEDRVEETLPVQEDVDDLDANENAVEDQHLEDLEALVNGSIANKEISIPDNEFDNSRDDEKESEVCEEGDEIPVQPILPFLKDLNHSSQIEESPQQFPPGHSVLIHDSKTGRYFHPLAMTWNVRIK